jgi:pyrimidine operon attenuation protein/uracil phosphoribosyltransferase
VSEPALREKGAVMDERDMERTLVRMAEDVLRHRGGLGSLVLVGVRSRGVPLAERLARALAKAGGHAPPVGALDISLYRDDFTTIAPQPVTKGTEIPFSIDGQDVLLVDDVLYTGRTIRCALDELIDFGRPARIELAVLVDRGHRELPIRADYVGQVVETAREEIVQVRLREQDGEDGVVLMERAPAPPPPAPKDAGGSRSGPEAEAPSRKRRPPAAPARGRRPKAAAPRGSGRARPKAPKATKAASRRAKRTRR